MGVEFKSKMGNKTLNLSAWIAELLGTLFLVFGICMVVMNIDAGHTTLLAVSLILWLVLSVSIFVFGDISGGHFNPAVTLPLMAFGIIDYINAIFYVVF